MRRAVLILAAATALLVGCSGGVEGSATADAPKDPWDPCSIPAPAIDAIGLDSTTKHTWGKGINVPDWLLCYWTGTEAGTRYYFNIRFSPVNTAGGVMNDPGSVEISRPSLSDRYKGYQYQSTSADASQECNIAVDTSEGVANFDVSVLGGLITTFDTCELVLSHTDALARYLPPPMN